MNIWVEDIVDAVVANFLRLPPEQRRQVLKILITDLDAPQQTDDEPKPVAGVMSGGLLGWLVESLPPTDIGVLSLFLKFHTISERELLSKGLPGSNPENMYPFWNQDAVGEWLPPYASELNPEEYCTGAGTAADRSRASSAPALFPFAPGLDRSEQSAVAGGALLR
jgi:hypothetical protein